MSASGRLHRARSPSKRTFGNIPGHKRPLRDLEAALSETQARFTPNVESDRPGLYVAQWCRNFQDTVPMLFRDTKRIENVDTTGPDRGADAIRYGCLRSSWWPR